MSGGIGRKPPTVSPAKPFNPFVAVHEHGHRSAVDRAACEITGCVPRAPKPFIDSTGVATRADRHRRNRQTRAPLPVAYVPAPWWRRLWACLMMRRSSG